MSDLIVQPNTLSGFLCISTHFTFFDKLSQPNIEKINKRYLIEKNKQEINKQTDKKNKWEIEYKK